MHWRGSWWWWWCVPKFWLAVTASGSIFSVQSSNFHRVQQECVGISETSRYPVVGVLLGDHPDTCACIPETSWEFSYMMCWLCSNGCQHWSRHAASRQVSFCSFFANCSAASCERCQPLDSLSLEAKLATPTWMVSLSRMTGGWCSYQIAAGSTPYVSLVSEPPGQYSICHSHS